MGVSQGKKRLFQHLNKAANVNKLNTITLQQFNDVGIVVKIQVFTDEIGYFAQQREFDQVIILGITAQLQFANRVNESRQLIELGDQPFSISRRNVVAIDKAWASQNTMQFFEMSTRRNVQAAFFEDRIK